MAEQAPVREAEARHAARRLSGRGDKDMDFVIEHWASATRSDAGVAGAEVSATGR